MRWNKYIGDIITQYIVHAYNIERIWVCGGIQIIECVWLWWKENVHDVLVAFSVQLVLGFEEKHR